jgi:hypothetical protein
LGLAAAYSFWIWLRKPTWRQALVAGYVLGLAQLCKTSWLVLYVLWPAVWIVWKSSARTVSANLATQRIEQPLQLATILAFSVFLINLSYGFDGTFTQLGEFDFVSDSLAAPTREQFPLERPNRFTDSPLAAIPLPLPRDYVLGIDIQKADFEHCCRPSYLRGTFRHTGWWYYYLYALAVKVPLGTSLLFSLSVILRFLPSVAERRWRDDIVVLSPAVALLALVSSQTGINHHVRYVLPAFPFAFVWASRAVAGSSSARLGVRMIALVALLWTCTSSLVVYPHSLSYFNELVGGPKGGHDHLLHSNIDWGQDLIYLHEWIERHQHSGPLYLAYYGAVDPSIVGIQYDPAPFLTPRSRGHSRKTPTSLSPSDCKPGLYAISVNFLRGDSWQLHDGKGVRIPVHHDAYVGLLHLAPCASVGYSIYIYDVSEEDLARCGLQRVLFDRVDDWRYTKDAT